MTLNPTLEITRCTAALVVLLCMLLAALSVSGPRLAQADDETDPVQTLIRQAGTLAKYRLVRCALDPLVGRH
jgi:hypothetical protein